MISPPLIASILVYSFLMLFKYLCSYYLRTNAIILDNKEAVFSDVIIRNSDEISENYIISFIKASIKYLRYDEVF